MSFVDYSLEDIEPVKKGLKLLGWSIDIRLTSEDAAMLSDIALEALRLEDKKQLSSKLIDELSYKAYRILVYQIMNPVERATALTYRYKFSEYLKNSVPIIDEALLCYYRGYYFSSSALLFIVTENCLRNIIHWSPGMPDPTFAQLKQALSGFTKSYAKDVATEILNIIYSRYDAVNPTQFYFNRHGILHGLRSATEFDELNTVRLIFLFDRIMDIENCSSAVIINKEFNFRSDMYSNCTQTNMEQNLLHN